MNTSKSSPRNAELNKKSLVILFTIGAIMLVVPVGTVLSENSICRSDAAACNHSAEYRYLVSAFPYIMLGGGILIGYNMKKISDHINAEDFDDKGDEEDRSGSHIFYS